MEHCKPTVNDENADIIQPERKKESTVILRKSVWDKVDGRSICISMTSTVNKEGVLGFSSILRVGIKNTFKFYKKIKTMPYIISNFTDKRK